MGKRKVLGSSIVGNAIEYYDFGIYAVFATIIGEQFFPELGEFMEILYTLSVFAIGFFMRPLGGIVFGMIGDVYGRKRALILSVIGMAISTLAIAATPTYDQIGYLAPIILILIRLVQGLCIGGEGAGTAIFVLEHLQGYKPGFIGGIVISSNLVGTLLATFIGILINHFFHEEFAWRIGFLIGGLLGFVGLYLRLQVAESPIFKGKSKSHKIPLFQALTTYLDSVIIVIFLGGVTNALSYTIRGYLNVMFAESLGYSDTEALYLMSFSLLVAIIALPFFGNLSDKIGYKRFMYITCYLIIVASYPIFLLITNSPEHVGMVILGLIILSLLTAAINAPAYAFSCHSFSPELRYSGMSFSWNLGVALFGGTTPMISHVLHNNYGLYSPSFYLITISFAFIAVSFLLRKSHQAKFVID